MSFIAARVPAINQLAQIRQYLFIDTLKNMLRVGNVAGQMPSHEAGPLHGNREQRRQVSPGHTRATLSCFGRLVELMVHVNAGASAHTANACAMLPGVYKSRAQLLLRKGNGLPLAVWGDPAVVPMAWACMGH